MNEVNNLQLPTNPTLVIPDVRRSFSVWVGEYKPDHVSKIVLASLLDNYINGDKEPLFAKFKQLIDSEHYKLAVIFRECLIYVGINDEFRAWANYA